MATVTVLCWKKIRKKIEIKNCKNILKLEKKLKKNYKNILTSDQLLCSICDEYNKCYNVKNQYFAFGPMATRNFGLMKNN